MESPLRSSKTSDSYADYSLHIHRCTPHLHKHRDGFVNRQHYQIGSTSEFVLAHHGSSEDTNGKKRTVVLFNNKKINKVQGTVYRKTPTREVPGQGDDVEIFQMPHSIYNKFPSYSKMEVTTRKLHHHLRNQLYERYSKVRFQNATNYLKARTRISVLFKQQEIIHKGIFFTHLKSLGQENDLEEAHLVPLDQGKKCLQTVYQSVHSIESASQLEPKNASVSFKSWTRKTFVEFQYM